MDNALRKIAAGDKEQRRAEKAVWKAAKKAKKQAKKDLKRGVPLEQVGRNVENHMDPAVNQLDRAFGLPVISPERPTEPTVVPNRAKINVFRTK